MTDLQIPIDFLQWSFALLPILVLMILMVKFRWTAPQAGMFGMFTAAGIALFAFQTPLETLAVGGAKGVWDALFILYVVWPALLLYQITDQAGGYEALRQGITRFSRNELFVVLALGWVFSSFLQGIAGFGTPIAVVAPLLVAFGVRPVYAVAFPIIAHVWAKFFGTLAVGWLATLQVVDLADQAAVAFQTGLLLIIPVVLGGFTVVWMYGRGPALRHAWPLVIIISIIHGGGQAVMTLVDPVLSTFIPATLALLALYPLSRWKRYGEMPDTIIKRPAMCSERTQSRVEAAAPMSFAMSFLPYVLLTALTIGALVIEPFKQALGAFSVGLPFPSVTTSYGIVREAATPYSPFAPLTHPGTFLLITAFVTWAIYRRRGYYSAQARAEGKEAGERSVTGALFADAIPASVPVIAFLAMAQMMNHSGQNEVLALGIAAVAPAMVFAFLSSSIGALGAFMTSSSTSSNVLFSDLQQSVAELKDLPEASIIAAQSAGGAIGNAIAPANVVLGASTAGISGQEGVIIRKTLPWTIAAVVLTGAATMLLVWLIP